MENKELNIPELFETDRYRDGGSISYEDQNGNKYWMDFSIGTKTRGMLYKGDINKDERKNPFNGSFSIKERNSENYQQVSKTELGEAIKVLQKHLSENKREGSWYHAFQCNIAMAFRDEYSRTPEVFKHDIHTIANQAAKNFLDNLIKE